MVKSLSQIRNFCIISHVDHGKSTLADRLLELTNTVPKEKMQPQYLDRMPLERERGITIKLQPVTMQYTSSSTPYTLNLIDTPGHVDFSYEVSRSLAAVEGAILLVDAGAGIQAQTLANLYLAQKQNLTIIPVINKIDLPSLDLEAVKKELAHLLKISIEEIICISAKKGINIENVLAAVIEKVPPPEETVLPENPLRALIFDSYFDEYRGVVAFVRIFNGAIKSGEKIQFLGTGIEGAILEVGVFTPDLKKEDALSSGEIGYIVTGFKEIEKCRVGDTISKLQIPNSKFQIEPLPGYREPQPMVFAELYPKDGSDLEKLRQAFKKLKLNDASLAFESIHSSALGFGFRAGFLGLLHLDIIKERLRREYDLDLVITPPTAAYQIKLKNGKSLTIHSASEFPDVTEIEGVEEPLMHVDIITPQAHFGQIMELVKKYRGRFISNEYIEQEAKGFLNKMILRYEMPLALLLVDFYDKLKSVSSGYASYSYDFLGYQRTEVLKLDILVANEPVEQLTTIVYKDQAYQQARRIAESLKDILPRQLFEVKIQAAVGGKILASERIPAMRKDVTAKLYGGDVTRKKKLLAKQKKGKKEMACFGKVNIPPEAYLAIMGKR